MLRKFILLNLVITAQSTFCASWFNFWPFVSGRQICAQDLRSAALEFKARHDAEVIERRQASNDIAKLIEEISKPNVSTYFTDSKPSFELHGRNKRLLTMVGAFQCNMLRKLEEESSEDVRTLGRLMTGSIKSCVKEADVNGQHYIRVNRIYRSDPLWLAIDRYEFEIMKRATGAKTPNIFQVSDQDILLHRVVGTAKYTRHDRPNFPAYYVTEFSWKKTVSATESEPSWQKISTRPFISVDE